MDNGNVIDSSAVAVNNMGIGSVLKIPAVRQVILLVGVAGAVAAGLAVFLWSQSPSYTPVYTGASAAEAAEVVSALRSANIEHKVNPVDNTVLVDASRLGDVNMLLASQGLVQDHESIEVPGIGTSVSFEKKILQQKAEERIARTIAGLASISTARVHLVMPEQSNFIRSRDPATASVFLVTATGHYLDTKQASAIAHTVASAVPNLDPSNVTLIDQHGRMLSTGDGFSTEALAASQLEYQVSVENNLKRKLEEILTPLVGIGNVRAQVSASIDFSHRETASEEYDGDNAAVVSRQVSESSVAGSAAEPSGVPGALSNQPPETGGEEPAAAEAVASRNSTSQRVENFEVPKRITYEKPQPATITRLSIAILVDDSAAGGDEDGATGLTPQQIAQLESLARETVGFDEARGDTVVVTNATFRDRVEVPEIEPTPIWEEPVLRDIAKQILGAGVVLAIVFGVVRPMLRNVVSSHAQAGAMSPAYQGATGGGVQPAVAIPAPSYDEKVAAARNISGNDPARVAQVVKQWVGDNG